MVHHYRLWNVEYVVLLLSHFAVDNQLQLRFDSLTVTRRAYSGFRLVAAVAVAAVAAVAAGARMQVYAYRVFLSRRI